MFQLSLQQLLFRFGGLLLVATIHGYAQALLAERLGDPGPKYDGRRSLNPLTHLDVLGSIAFVLFAVGWIKPLKLDPKKLRHPRRDAALIVLGALATNVALALALRLLRPLAATVIPGNAAFWVLAFFNTTITLSLWLVALNLMPLPPLTGFQALRAFVPRLGPLIERYALYPTLALVTVVGLGWTDRALSPLFKILSRFVGLG